MKPIIALLLLVLIAFLFAGCATFQAPSDYQYNWRQQRWEIASPRAELKYNIYTDEWRYIE